MLLNRTMEVAPILGKQKPGGVFCEDNIGSKQYTTLTLVLHKYMYSFAETVMIGDIAG